MKRPVPWISTLFKRFATWLGPRVGVLFLGCMAWQFTEVAKSRTWFDLGIHAFMMTIYGCLSFLHVQWQLRDRRIVLRPIPFPTPDSLPGLAPMLNRVQKLAEEEAAQRIARGEPWTHLLAIEISMLKDDPDVH